MRTGGLFRAAAVHGRDAHGGFESGQDVGHSDYAARFGMLHGVSSLFYLIESLLGVALVWKLPVTAGVPSRALAAPRGKCRLRCARG